MNMNRRSQVELKITNLELKIEKRFVRIEVLMSIIIAVLVTYIHIISATLLKSAKGYIKTLLTDLKKECIVRQYTHLTEHERYHIWLMIGQQDSLTSGSVCSC